MLCNEVIASEVALQHSKKLHTVVKEMYASTLGSGI